MKKIILILSIFILSFANELRYDTFKWPNSVSFLQFLEQHSISKSLYYDLSNEDRELTSEIRAGINCEILKDENDKIYQILIPISQELQIHIFRDKDDKFKLDFVPILTYEYDRELAIKISNSPSVDIQNATGSGALANLFASIFKGQIDERRFQKGDNIAIIYKQKIRLGKPYGDPTIISALAQQNKFKKYLFQYDSKFYDENGKKSDSFLFRLPVKPPFRVSSKFSPKRYHPILKKYRAHLGTDYAAPKGTPIYAAGDGVIRFVGKKGGYGNTVEIKHSGGYVTLYAHTSKFANSIKVGKHVKQGELIAYIGNTGLSSGPHLHIGLYKNNTAIDFEKVVYVEKATMQTKEEKEFKALVKHQKALLDAAIKTEKKVSKFEPYDNSIGYE